MAQLTPQASELLQKALDLSAQDRGALVDQLIRSLDEKADANAEEAWSEEINRRIDDVRSGKVAMIPGEEVRRRLGRRLLHGRE